MWRRPRTPPHAPPVTPTAASSSRVTDSTTSPGSRSVPPGRISDVRLLPCPGPGQPCPVARSATAGDCSLAGRRARPNSREHAIRALTEGLEPCTL
ncbi:DUF6233 domain-containing protein [Streptomyces noursei]|uniref:DUF6233 domain-containing protein n=1 Tax=Streptomyces noursei TaxID=1971 RepID=UPI0036AB97B7